MNMTLGGYQTLVQVPWRAHPGMYFGSAVCNSPPSGPSRTEDVIVPNTDVDFWLGSTDSSESGSPQ